MLLERESIVPVNEYLNQKYIDLSRSVLDEKFPEGFFSEIGTGINFSTILDGLVFVLLYEDKKYNQVLEGVKHILLNKLKQKDDLEINFLLIKCLDSSKELQEPNVYFDKEYLIAHKCQEYINQEVLRTVSLNSGEYLELFIRDLKEDIKNFAYSGSPEGGDYDLHDYWEEYCSQVQYGDGYLLEIMQDDIIGHIYSKLNNKVPYKEVILLYTTTDEYDFSIDDHNNFREIPSKDEMVDHILSKVMEELSWIASRTDIPDFRAGEDWDEDEDED